MTLTAVAKEMKRWRVRVRGCHTQAKTLDTLMKRMREAVELCLETEDGARHSLELVGVQQISI